MYYKMKDSFVSQNSINKESLKKQKNSSIPILLGILVVLFVILIGLVVWQFYFNKQVSNGLQGVYITDINDKSAVISWVTSQPVKTELVFSTSDVNFLSQFGIKDSKTGYDKRDLEEVDEFVYKVKKRGKYYTHSVLLRDLKPETQYFFGIKNGIFLNSTKYVNTFTTTKVQEDVEAPDIAYGEVLDQDGKLISDTLLFINLTNLDDTNQSQVISYVFDGNTGWSVDLSNLWDKDFKSKYVRDDSAYLNIRVVNSAGESKKLIKYGDIRPVENISTYDNLSIEEKEEEVKGVLLKNVNAASRYQNCEESGGVWRDGVCTCARGYKLNSSGYCVSESPSCTRQSGICACNCPASYSETKPSGEYDTTTVSCPTIDNCGKSCGNPVKKTCYKAKTSSSCTCRCTPTCPADYPVTQNNGLESVERTCTTTDTCGKLCTSTIKCYKASPAEKVNAVCGGNAKVYTSGSTQWDSVFCKTGTASGFNPSSEFPQPRETVTWKCLGKNGGLDASCSASRQTDEIKDIPKKECKYDPQLQQEFYWCECNNGGKSACVSATYLYDNTNSSCVKYCELSAKNFVKTKICGEGELANCKYGCEEKGPEENDTCKPKPTDVGQEFVCREIRDIDWCNNDTDGKCTWHNGSCRSVVSVYGGCSNLKTQKACELKYGCEYKNGECKKALVTTSTTDSDLDLNGYINLLNSDICTGVTLVGGKTAKVTQGTNMENVENLQSYHVNESSCAIDLSVPTGTPLGSGQIAGYEVVNGKGVWEKGYKCTAGSGGGFGNYIDVTQPNGEIVRYAHLASGSCSWVQSGATGNSDSSGHLHVEVLATDDNEAGNCDAERNPCEYIAGGCYRCDSRSNGVPVSSGDDLGFQVDFNTKNLMSKALAAEQWPDASKFVDNLKLAEGVYKVTYGTGSKTTQFVKTNDNHIVFFSDDNDNGILDENEYILSPAEAQYEYSVSYAKVADSFKLTLTEGFNLVAFPIIFTDGNGKDISKASDLIDFLNEGGAQITSIAAFRSGKFIIYTNRNGEVYGDDFNILPGEGYFLKSLSDGVFLYSGKKVENSLEVQLYEGWNLVNIYNSNKTSYSGFNILKQMKQQSINSIAISKWEDSRYYTIASQDGKDYGNDFKIYPTRGYFVRVESGNGKFSPN